MGECWGGVDFPCIYVHHCNIASVPFVTVRNVCVETMLCITFPSTSERPRRVLTLRAENLQSYDGFRIQAGLLSGKGLGLFQMYRGLGRCLLGGYRRIQEKYCLNLQN